MFGVDDHQVGLHILAVFEYRLGVVVVAATHRVVGNALLRHVLLHLLEVGLQGEGILCRLDKTEDVHCGAEDFGHLGSGRHFLSRVGVDADGHHDTFQCLVEVESLADGEHRAGGLLHDADSGAAHDVFLVTRGAVGAYHHHLAVVVTHSVGDGVLHLATQDLPFDPSIFHVGVVLGAEGFQLFGGFA